MTPRIGPFVFVVAHSNTAPPLTDWYEADQLPVRSGVYEVGGPNEAEGFFRYFDGANWYMGGTSPDEALREFQITGERVSRPLRWRGLTERTK